MNNNWEVRKLGEICEKITDGTHSTPTYLPEGIPFLSVKNLTKGFIDLSDTRFISIEEHNSLTKRCKPERNDILYTKVGTTGIAKVVDIDDEFSIFVSLALLKINHDQIYNKYLEHFLNAPFAREQAQKRTRGMANKNLVIGDIKEIEIHFPKSITDQQRIVAILDEAFAAIAQAKENAEKNLQNARELFDSYLHSLFANPGDGWEVKTLGEIATFRNGINFTKGSKGETIKIVGVKDFQKNFWIPFDNLESATVDGKLSEIDVLQDDDILAVRSNGNPELIGRTILADDVTEKTSHSGFTIRIRLNSEKVFPQYLCHYMKSQTARKQLVESGTGINIKSLNQVALSSLLIPIPPFLQQKTLVNKLESLLVESEKLEAIYRQKVGDLEELKKSILQKAFSGELTAEYKRSNVIQFPAPVTIPNISTTDLHAGIIATAYQRHQEKGNILTFGHVKAEKTVDFTQLNLNIELEREALKNAAGPNDFPRLKQVEHRANHAGFFYVNKQGSGYTYTKGKNFDSLIEKTKNALGDKYAELIHLIDLLVPMDTKGAEIVATVYAAWNNLLIDNLPINDEAIAYEARENWHEAKLKIPRERFFETINWLQENNLIPKGQGKKVLHKGVTSHE